MNKTTSITVAALALFVCFFQAAITHADKAGSEDRIKAHVTFLASGALEGRETGERGDRISEMYVQSIFEQAGLAPAPGMEHYCQEFILLESELDRENTYLAVKSEDSAWYFRVDREVFYSLRGHQDMTVSAPVVFAGFGITAPEYDYDDYGDIDVTGKIVLIFNHEPGETSDGKKFRGRMPTSYSRPRIKADIARDHGAVGVIIIDDEANGHEDLDQTLMARFGSELKKPYLGLPDEAETIPLFYATRAVTRALLAGTNIDLVERQKKIDERFKPLSQPIPGKEVDLTVRLERVDKKRVNNVIGYLEGTDPDLKKEVIVIGAHHDHIGMADDGSIRYGADDNASGTAGLMESAVLLQNERLNLGRSILFVSFCGEEKGLLGSTWFVEHPPVKKKYISAMINLDMIGRNNMDKEENSNMFIVYTSAQTPLLERLARSEASALGVDARVAPYLQFRGASDHMAFHQEGIPVVFYFSGFHDDYDTPGDTADKLLCDKIAKIARHLSRVVAELSNRPDTELLFDRSITEEPPKDEYENPYMRRGRGK